MKITEINLAMQKCHKNKVLVYPVMHLGKWYIERDSNGQRYRYPKHIEKDKQSISMELTYIDLANKLQIMYHLDEILAMLQDREEKEKNKPKQLNILDAISEEEKKIGNNQDYIN